MYRSFGRDHESAEVMWQSASRYPAATQVVELYRARVTESWADFYKSVTAGETTALLARSPELPAATREWAFECAFVPPCLHAARRAPVADPQELCLQLVRVAKRGNGRSGTAG